MELTVVREDFICFVKGCHLGFRTAFVWMGTLSGLATEGSIISGDSWLNETKTPTRLF